MLEVFFISVIIVFIVDYSGFIESIEASLKRYFKAPIKIPKPFSCSLCMTFWVSLIYLLCTVQFTLWNITWVCIISWSTIIQGQVMIIFRDFILRLLGSLEK